MLIRPLFEKYQQQLLAFANTQIGRAYLDIKSTNKIVKVVPDGFHEYIGTEKGKDYFKATLFPRSPLLNKFELALMGMALVEENYEKLKFKNLLEFDHAFVIPHYLGINPVGFLPKINFATSTFNPDAHPESTTVDGRAYHSLAGQTWSNLRSAAGNGSGDADANTGAGNAQADTTSNQFKFMSRGIFLFDTSSIPDGDSVTSATFSVYVVGKSTGMTVSENITSSNPASNTAIVNADFALANYGSTKFSTARTIASMTTSTYEDFVLNASGLAAINKTGITKLAARLEEDIDNSAPTWVSNQVGGWDINMADNGSNIPKLVVVYSTLSGNVIMFQGGGIALA